MANWQSSSPREGWSDIERANFFREIWTRIKFGSFTWTPPLIAAGDTVTFDVADGGTVDTKETIGLRIGMPIFATAPASLTNGLSIQALVTTNDQLDLVIANTTAGGLTPPPGLWSFAGVII